jgi:hypothetical protein
VKFQVIAEASGALESLTLSPRDLPKELQSFLKLLAKAIPSP